MSGIYSLGVINNVFALLFSMHAWRLNNGQMGVCMDGGSWNIVLF